MRLRELTFPFAAMGPQNLWGFITEFSEFEFSSYEYVTSGGLDDIHFFDAQGNEYIIDKIEIHRIGWWKSFLYSRKMVKLDMQLKRIATLSLDELKHKFEYHVRSHPEWEHNGDGAWQEKDIEASFHAPRTYHAMIENIGRYNASVHDYLEPQGSSSKLVDLR
jgi:hypothetical protein